MSSRACQKFKNHESFCLRLAIGVVVCLLVKSWWPFGFEFISNMEIISTYNIWFLSSLISFLFSLLLLYHFFSHSILWSKMFYLLSAYLAFLDLITTSSWFISPKYHTSFFICSIQEYLFQGSLLCKSFTTLSICLLSCQVIYTMTIPSLTHIFILLLVCNLMGIICVIASIVLGSSQIFCSNTELEDISPSTLHGYIYFTIVPLYICVIINLLIYIAIRYRISSSVAPRPTSPPSPSLEPGKPGPAGAFGTSGGEVGGESLLFQQNQQKLLQIVKRMLFYPLLFGICLFPEAVFLIASLFTDHIPTWLYYLSASFIGMMGTMVTLNYFSRQTDQQDGRFIFPFRLFSMFTSSAMDSQGPGLGGREGAAGAPGVVIGRNLSSLLWWESSAPPPQDRDRESQSDYDEHSDRYTSNPTFPRYTEHLQAHSSLREQDFQGGTTGVSNPMSLYPIPELLAAAAAPPPGPPSESEQRFSEVELYSSNQQQRKNNQATRQQWSIWRGI
jgi:hypothetical protein